MNAAQLKNKQPITGTGVGLRHAHLENFISQQPAIPWLEILTDNHVESDETSHRMVEVIRTHYPMTFHCVGMNLGSTDDLNEEYFKRIKLLANKLQPAWISDHICFTGINGVYYHELLPLPYTEESLQHLASRIQQAQDMLGQRLLVENPSAYGRFEHSTIDEWTFINELVRQADCDLLLDLNNIYVNSRNMGFDPYTYIKAMPFDRVREIHLAGFEDRGNYLLDAHNSKVADPVWSLFDYVMQNHDTVPTLIEWDNDIPELGVLLGQAGLAETHRHTAQLKQKLVTA
jgi:uncharacterized protein (UPF0276 family)